MNQAKQKRPWYRERLVWMLIALPASAVLGGIVTIVLATRTSDGLVADDYYKQGIAINKTIARDDRARDLGLDALLRLSEGTIRLSLQSKRGAELPARLLLTFVHPTRAGEDRSIVLERNGDEFYGQLGRISAGHWQVRIEDEARSWRMNGTAYFPTETAIRITSEVPKS